jgi:adenosylcobinamide kinase/adenosylcobinamide-phosphate guanylyltransferase
MRKIVLVTGGARSGKSEFALKLAESLEGPRTFVATCPESDDELKLRIQKHRARRDASTWKTLEEKVDLGGALEKLRDESVILIDCLTLWIYNVMKREKALDRILTEEMVQSECEAVLDRIRDQRGSLIFVTNEVGLGIVPVHPVARLFRDLAGRCNQTVARAADQVAFMVCGLPLYLKGGPQ